MASLVIQKSPLLDFPDELLVKILSKSIDKESIGPIQQVCKKFQGLMNDYSTNLPWKALCTIDDYEKKEDEKNWSITYINSLTQLIENQLDNDKLDDDKFMYEHLKSMLNTIPMDQLNQILSSLDSDIKSDEKLDAIQKADAKLNVRIVVIKFLIKKGEIEKARKLLKDLYTLFEKSLNSHLLYDKFKYQLIKIHVLLNDIEKAINLINKYCILKKDKHKAQKIIVKTLLKQNKIDDITGLIDKLNTSSFATLANFEAINYYFEKNEIDKAIDLLHENLYIYENIESFDKDKYLFQSIKYLLQLEKKTEADKCIGYLREPYYIDKAKLELIKFYLKKEDYLQVAALINEITFTILKFEAYLEYAKFLPEDEAIWRKIKLTFDELNDISHKTKAIKHYIKAFPLSKKINLPKHFVYFHRSCGITNMNISRDKEINRAKFHHVKELLGIHKKATLKADLLKALKLIHSIKDDDYYLSAKKEIFKLIYHNCTSRKSV